MRNHGKLLVVLIAGLWLCGCASHPVTVAQSGGGGIGGTGIQLTQRGGGGIGGTGVNSTGEGGIGGTGRIPIDVLQAGQLSRAQAAARAAAEARAAADSARAAQAASSVANSVPAANAGSAADVPAAVSRPETVATPQVAAAAPAAPSTNNRTPTTPTASIPDNTVAVIDTPVVADVPNEGALVIDGDPAASPPVMMDGLPSSGDMTGCRDMILMGPECLNPVVPRP